MNVRFKNPPINELIIGTYFDPPLFSLQSEHVGLLWSRWRDSFPIVEQRMPISGAQGPGPVVTAGNAVPGMPRYWFVSEDKVNLIQVQKNAYFLNWRRHNSDYPHFFEQLKPSFDQYYDIFESFIREEVGEHNINIEMCELTYVDAIEPCDYWQGPLDTAKVIPSFSLPVRGHGNECVTAFNNMYLCEVSARLNLHVAIRTVVAADDPPSPPRLVLEFKALGRLGGVPKSETATWYSEAHDTIVACFLNMTSKDVQREYWMLEQDDQ